MNGGGSNGSASLQQTSTSTHVSLNTTRGKKRVALQDRDLAMLSLASQDQPNYYDSPPTSPPLAPFPRTHPAYPTSLTRSPLNPSTTTSLRVSNRGNKLDPTAPFTNPLKLGHHAHVDQGFKPSTTSSSSSSATDSCLKKRKLNDLSSTSTKDGFLIAPNLQLLPRGGTSSGLKDAEHYRDGGGPLEAFPSFLPLPPQSPLDLILLPHIQSIFSPKNYNFHLLSESCTGLIEQESELVGNLKKVCSGLRGEGFEWRWKGDELREIDRRNKREERDKQFESERVEREKLRKEQREKVLRERKERKEREKLEKQRLAAVALAEQEEEERRRKRQQEQEEEQDSIVKPEPDQTPTLQPAQQPVSSSGVEYAHEIPVNVHVNDDDDVEMNNDHQHRSTLLTTIPTPSSLPSLPLPPAPPLEQPVQQEDTTMSIANDEQQQQNSGTTADSLIVPSSSSVNPLTQKDPTSSSSSSPSVTTPRIVTETAAATIENLNGNQIGGGEGQPQTMMMTGVEEGEEQQQQQSRSEPTTTATNLPTNDDDSTSLPLPLPESSEQPVSQTTTSTSGNRDDQRGLPQDSLPSTTPVDMTNNTTTTKDSSTPVVSNITTSDGNTTTTETRQQEQPAPPPPKTKESQPEPEPLVVVESGEQTAEQPQPLQQQGVPGEEPEAEVEAEGVEEGEEVIEEPTIRRSGRQTRATVGLRASQLLFEEGGTVATNSLVGGSGGRGLSYSPDPYGLAISTRFGGSSGGIQNQQQQQQNEEIESDVQTPRSSLVGGTTTTNNNNNNGVTAVDESDLELEEEEEEEEELPLIPEEDIPEYAHRLIDPERYVKQLFVTDGPVELEKSLGTGVGGVETLSPNEQEALVHGCLTDLHRFLSDTLEYRDRLSEIRDGVLEVERRRKGMWKVVRTVALDWLEEEAAGGGIGGTGTSGVNGSGTTTGVGVYEGYE
ncbi:hypothetical protein JCM5350_003387 [Sporobolomyces pararoseus]